MKRFQLSHVTSPLVEMECGGTVVRSTHIKNAKENPNFPDPVISFDMVRKPSQKLSKLDDENLPNYLFLFSHGILVSAKGGAICPAPEYPYSGQEELWTHAYGGHPHHQVPQGPSR